MGQLVFVNGTTGGQEAEMNPDEYQCEQCGGVFEKGWSDEDAETEMAMNGWAREDMALVCDDCYLEIMGEVHRKRT